MSRMPPRLAGFVVSVPILLVCLSSVAGGLAQSCPAPPPQCKYVPGDAQWPSPATWAAFNESTGGRLLRPPPPGAVCHPGQPTYDAAACPAVQTAWSAQAFHDADPISNMWNQWNNDSCLPFTGDPCSGQGYPVYVVNASSVDHVKAGVDFARDHNIRLIVKASGHDYLGRSGAPNALSIWVHHMTGIQILDSFSPQNCAATYENVVTAAAGSLMVDLYQQTDAVNRTIVGGGGETVTVGGYLTGGGHSLLSARYGLAADQVVEMDIVTPMGEALTLNECQNTDLFWAMRGGGGSTFGIMTSVTMKTHPTPKLINYEVAIATYSNTSAAQYAFDMVAYVLSQFPSLGDQGVSGYSYIFESAPNPLDGGQTKISGIVADVVLQDTEDPADMVKLWEPIFEHVNQTWPGFLVAPVDQTGFASFWAWFQVHYDTSQAGIDVYVGSRLLDGEALTANLTALSAAFKGFTADGISTAYLVSGPGVWNAQPAGGSDAVCPAWRKAYVHATVGPSFAPLNLTARLDTLKLTTDLVEPLRILAPDMGAYVNEADPDEPNWQHAFWGANYPRLLEIKRAVDPDDVLWCTPCVGNERWQQVDDRLCRV